MLWVSLVETLWSEVEAVFGKYAVRLHRASINLAKEEEMGEVTRQTRIERRRMALFKFKASVIISECFPTQGLFEGSTF